MKCFSCVAIVLIVMVATVRAEHTSISTSFEQITADSGHFESAFVEHIPTGYTSWAMEVTTTPGEKWVGTLMQLELSEGSIYYHPFGIPDRTAPNAALFTAPGFESLRFTSFVASPTIAPPLGQRRRPLVPPDPIIAGQDKQWDAQNFVTAWLDGDPLSPDSVPGTHVIGIFTISNDAQGDVLFGKSADGACCHILPTVDFVAFDNWFVQDGAFDFTAPPPPPPPPPPPTPPPTTFQPFLIGGTGFEDSQVGAAEHTVLTGDEFGFTRAISGAATSGVIDASPADPTFTNGAQGYSVGGEGQVELDFDAVSWNPDEIRDVEVTLDVWLAAGDYLPQDALRILADVSSGDLSETLTLFDVTGTDIEAGALIEGEWNSLRFEIADEWRQATLQIVSNIANDLGSDTFIFDNIGFAGAPPPPPWPPTTDQPFFIAGTGFEDPQVDAVEHPVATGNEIGFTVTISGAATSGVIDA
ncbi:MAG: hypothetical protein IID44_14105, partial [Planctomycetes bacterium]|nr:hypothetical protein [Planctomycetota bacterium]